MNIDFNDTGSVFVKHDLQLINPYECVEAGVAVGRAIHDKKVGVGYAGDCESRANALALMAGLSSVGISVWDFGAVFESQLSFFVPFASLGAGVFINAKDNTVKLFGDDGLTVSNAMRKKVNGVLEDQAVPFSDYGKIFDMSALEILYRDELIKQAVYGITAECKIISTNSAIQDLLRDILPQSSREDALVLRVNRFGTSLSAYTKQTGVVPFVKLVALCGMYELKNGRDISVPFDAPRFLDDLAKTFGKTAYRYLAAPSDGSDSLARRLAARQFWSRDALFTAVKLMSVLSENETTFPQLYSELPPLYISRTVVDLDVPIENIQEFKGEGFSVGRDGGNGIFIYGERGQAHLSPLSNGKYSITAQSNDVETAQELCADIMDLITKWSTH